MTHRLFSDKIILYEQVHVYGFRGHKLLYKYGLLVVLCLWGAEYRARFTSGHPFIDDWEMKEMVCKIFLI
jgi:hypothetical protein